MRHLRPIGRIMVRVDGCECPLSERMDGERAMVVTQRCHPYKADESHDFCYQLYGIKNGNRRLYISTYRYT